MKVEIEISKGAGKLIAGVIVFGVWLFGVYFLGSLLS